MSTSSIILTVCSSFILTTWPYHFSRFLCVIFVDACTTLVVPLMCSFMILSHLALHISISASSTNLLLVVPLIRRTLVVAHVSAPYNRAGQATIRLAKLFCKPFPSVSLASSCHTTLHCISSSVSMLHSLSV